MENEFELALRADKRVDDFLRQSGYDPNVVRMEPGYEKLLPKDVLADLEYSRDFWDKQKANGVTL